MTLTAKIRDRARELVKTGCPPSVAIRKALQEVAISEGSADPTQQRSPHSQPGITPAIRQQLLDSYKHKHLEETKCAFCWRVGSPIALHIVEFHHPEAQPTPSSFIPMSRSRGTTHGSVPVCIRCSPPCKKCALPVATPWTAKMAKALQSKHSGVSITLGNGVCHQHIHPVADLLSLFQHARLPSDGVTSHRDPVRAARRALREIEADGDVPGLHAIKDKLLALITDRKRTTASLVEDRLDPKALIYLLIGNITHAELCTGQHHIYRGILSASGQQLLSAFIVSSERMMEHRLHDRAKHDADVASLREEISEIG